MAKKKNKKSDKPPFHKDLKGLELKINEIGEITSNIDIDKINAFLNENVEDKKLKDRDTANEEE